MVEGEIEQNQRLLFLDDPLLHNKMKVNVVHSFPKPTSAIWFAREFDLPQILPAAFYHLARIPTRHNWDELRANHNNLDHSVYNGGRSARWNLLSTEDFFCLTRGREHLTGQTKVLQEYISDLPGILTHKHGKSCHERFTRLDYKLRHISPYDVLHRFRIAQSLEDEARPEIDLCSECCKRVLDYSTVRRWKVWDGLREAFGLPVREIYFIPCMTSLLKAW